ncbi:MAG: carboxypeptidase regulatory-like domain-containing protein [Candidatus Acidiferrales bacterium]
MRLIRLFLVVLLASTVFAIGAQNLLAQTASTGALTGTVTDPSGGVIAGATVKIANLATGQTRTTTTDANGSYQLSLLPPGNYSVHFEATGFRSTDVPSVTVNVTETPTLNRKLEIGTSTQQVTVEANTQAIQTENATNGTVVGAEEINSLPLVTRNYTQIVDLSPGVGGNVSNATALGNGTQDVNAAGQSGLSNSYSMDGANITQYTSGGAAQIGSMPGIPIPNPDTIQEFKVQTSQYDAGYGRNSGANVEVITKTGSNSFHGDLWEFNRNNFFNANDFFYKNSELSHGQANTPQTLKENTFGFTLGGPIKRNKILFFGSYQGFRQIDGIATNGFAGGYEPAAYLMPWNDYADQASGACSDLRCSNNIPAYRAYLGSIFGATAPCSPVPTGFGVVSVGNCNTGFVDGVTVANNGSNITNTAIALLQAKGPTKGGAYNQGGYLIAAAPQNCPVSIPGEASSGCKTALSVPIIANENQYMLNSQYNLSSRNTLYENYFYSSDPEIDSFDCLFGGSCNPGSPAHDVYTSHTGTLRLQSILTPNLINEARFTFYRDGEVATDPTTLSACDLPNGASIIPQNNNGEPCSSNVKYANAYMGIVPTIDVLDLYSPDAGDWSQGINFAGVGYNVDNDFQAGDQVSWNHGIHTLRFGFEWDHQQYNNNTVASAKGEVLFDNNGDFLTSSSGATIDGTPQTGLPPRAGTPAVGCGFLGFSNCAGGASPIALRGLLTHYNRIGDYDWFVQDDIKVNSRLTVNVGVRWEYQGWPSDALGQFANLWQSQMAKVNTGSFFLADAASPGCANGPNAPVLPVGTLAGFVVPSNYDKAAGFTDPCGASGVLQVHNKTLLSGSPLNNFMPRLGVAWQPFGNKLVVRAGYGWFYDEAGSIYLVDNLLQEPPYSGPIAGTSVSNLENTLHSPFQSIVGIPLTWTPRYFAPGFYNLNGYNAFGSLSYSALANANNSNVMSQRLPLTQQYNLDFQYALRGGWVLDVGYLGSHSIHLLNQGTPYNVAHLVGSPSTLLCGGVTGDCAPQDLAMLNNPTFPGGNPIPFNDPANTTPVTVNSTQNAPARVSYIGFTPGATVTTTKGDDLYNALLVNVRHNFMNGVLLSASYTWSSNRTNVNGAVGELDAGQNDFGTSGSNNPLDFAQQYGPNSAERTQRLIVSYSYDLPWKSTQGFSGKILGGWELSGITTVQNGQPFTVTDGSGGSIYGTGSRALLADPADCGANGVCKSGIRVGTPGSTTARVLSGLKNPAGGGWINPSAFTNFATVTATSPYCIGGVSNPTGSTDNLCGAAPSFFAPPGSPAALGSTEMVAGTGWGNAPVGILTGPGQFSWDFVVQKNTKVTEWGTLQFRAEFYNLFNHPQFNNPAAGVGGGTFGEIQSTSVEPRVIQFGLKFLF